MAKQAFWDLVADEEERPAELPFERARDGSRMKPWQRWSVEDAADIYILYFREGHTPSEIADMYGVSQSRIYNLLRTKPFNFRIEDHNTRLVGRKLMLAHRIMDMANETLDRLEERAKDPDTALDLKTKIDFGLLDRSGMGPKSSLDITHHKDDKEGGIELPGKDVKRLKEVMGELGKGDLIDAVVEDGNNSQSK